MAPLPAAPACCCNCRWRQQAQPGAGVAAAVAEPRAQRRLQLLQVAPPRVPAAPRCHLYSVVHSS